MNIANFLGTTAGMVVVVVFIAWLLLWFLVPFLIESIRGKLIRIHKDLDELADLGHEVIHELKRLQPADESPKLQSKEPRY